LESKAPGLEQADGRRFPMPAYREVKITSTLQREIKTLCDQLESFAWGLHAYLDDGERLQKELKKLRDKIDDFKDLIEDLVEDAKSFVPAIA
jgi:hypothetical protein